MPTPLLLLSRSRMLLATAALSLFSWDLDIDLPVLAFAGKACDNQVVWCKSLTLADPLTLDAFLQRVRTSLDVPSSTRNETLARALRVASVIAGDDFVARLPVNGLKSNIKRVSHRHFFFRFCLKLFFFSKEKHGFSLAARRCVAIG
jgi:hypothetical protein